MKGYGKARSGWLVTKLFKENAKTKIVLEVTERNEHTKKVMITNKMRQPLR
jgi:hypothetical protein